MRVMWRGRVGRFVPHDKLFVSIRIRKGEPASDRPTRVAWRCIAATVADIAGDDRLPARGDLRHLDVF
jgi:hypothetical protein